MINAVTGITAEAAEASIADSVGADQDMFLQLLVAQVRYQDPLEPMDNNEYMAQTAQFTMVEQITKLAEQQTELLAFQRAILAAGMVGQNVSGYDEFAGQSVTGVVDAVEYNYGDPQLVIGSQRVGLDEITSTGITASGTIGSGDAPEIPGAPDALTAPLEGGPTVSSAAADEAESGSDLPLVEIGDEVV